MDAVTSFQHLVDGIPGWRTDIEKLTDYAVKKYSEFVAEYNESTHHVRPRRRKTSSVASIESDEGNHLRPPVPLKDDRFLTVPCSSNPVRTSSSEIATTSLHAQTQRKRKQGTSVKSNGSIPVHHGNKKSIVIYYDAYIQTQLDTFVKSLGSARNNLRRGKNAYVASRGFGLPMLGRKYEHSSRLDGPPFTKLGKTTTIQVTATVSEQPIAAADAFLKVDKDLESIQALCETAAHQAIRDGDCKANLQSAVQELSNLLAVAESWLETFKTEESNKNSASTQDEEASISPEECVQIPQYNDSLIGKMSVLPKLQDPQTQTRFTTKQPNESTITAPATQTSTSGLAIEVGDEDDSDSSIDIDIAIAKYRTIGSRRLVVS